MSTQKKIIIAAVFIITLSALVAGVVYKVRSSDDVDILPPENAKGINLLCSNGYIGKVTYYDADKDGSMSRLLLITEQGEDIKRYLMRQVVSASGAKFSTRDKLATFWEHQGEFIFDNNGVSIATCRDASKQTFMLDGETITLTDGFLEKEIAPGSVTKDVIRYFGNDAVGDINGDGKDDTVFFVTRETGGTGIFYYAVGMLATDILPRGTKATLIGDRIAPQTLEVRDGIVVVNYADRKEGEAFTVEPSVGKTLRLKLDSVALDFGEVIEDFEGEADIDTMNLSMKEWQWVKTVYNGDKEVFPTKKDAFVASFSKEGNVSFSTDCNTMNAKYSATAEVLSFGPFMSTMMFCEGSQETEFSMMLKDVEKFSFTSRGELILTLTKKGEMMLFR